MTSGTFPIENFVDYIASWDRTALKPTLLHVSVNSLIQGNWRVGRWQVSKPIASQAFQDHFGRMLGNRSIDAA